MAPTLYTVGHSTRSFDELVEILRGHGVGGIADVRRFPGSRRHPQFGRDALERTLPAAGIAYTWYEALGGRRSRPREAPASAWRVPAFAAYADYLNTDPFRAAMARLLEWVAGGPVAVMCAEAVPYSCHRRLISDWAELHAVPAIHLLTPGRSERHRLTPFAHLEGERVIYAPDGQLPLLPP